MSQLLSILGEGDLAIVDAVWDVGEAMQPDIVDSAAFHYLRSPPLNFRRGVLTFA